MSGRITGLTQEIAARAGVLLPDLVYLGVVADALGVPRRTFRNWMARGRAEGVRLEREPESPPQDSESVYLALHAAMKKGKADRQGRAVAAIVEAYTRQESPQWQAAAWMLERTCEGFDPPAVKARRDERLEALEKRLEELLAKLDGARPHAQQTPAPPQQPATPADAPKEPPPPRPPQPEPPLNLQARHALNRRPPPRPKEGTMTAILSDPSVIVHDADPDAGPLPSLDSIRQRSAEYALRRDDERTVKAEKRPRPSPHLRWQAMRSSAEDVPALLAMLDECHGLMRAVLASGRPLPGGAGPAMRELLERHGAGEGGAGRNHSEAA